MINANDTKETLEKWYADNVQFWMRQKNDSVNEREANRRALEWDLIEIYLFNGKCLHNPYTPNSEELDNKSCLDFFKYRCMDLYGRAWETHYKKYNLE